MSTSDAQVATIKPERESALQVNSSLKPVQNTFGPCTGCDKEPEPGQRFARCSSCRAVLYCSKDCQKGDWPKHKLICKKNEWVELMQDAERRKVPPPRDSLFPARLSFSKRSTLLRDFMTIHMWSFRGSIRHVAFATKDKRGTPIDPSVEGISVRLRYRRGNDGNPARTFRLDGMGAFTKNELDQWGRAGPPLDPEARKRKEAGWRAQFGDRYIGSLTLLFEAEELKVGMQEPLLDFTPEEEVYLALAAPNWAAELRDNIDAGLVLERSSNGRGTERILPGEMHKEGNVWKWKKLALGDDSAAETTAMAQYNKIQLNQTHDLLAELGIHLPD